MIEEKEYIKPEYKYSEITGKIIGCAMRVQAAMGPGFQEVIYQRCLEIEFQEQNIPYKREHEMPIFYHNIQVGTRRVDFLVEECIMVEIKAIKQLEDKEIAQTLNYLESYGLEIGLLLNFGSKSLEYKRLIKSKKIYKKSVQSN